MPQYVPNQTSNTEVLFRRIANIEKRLNALSALAQTYLSKGVSRYTLDNNGNTVFIEGDISTAPMGVGTSSPSNPPTGLSGRGAASYATGTWVQV